MTDYIVPQVKVTVSVNYYYIVDKTDDANPVIVKKDNSGKALVVDHDLVMNSMLRVSKATPMTKVNGLDINERNAGFSRGVTDTNIAFRVPVNSLSVEFLSLCCDAKADLKVVITSRNGQGFYIHGETYNHVRINESGYTIRESDRTPPFIEFPAMALRGDFMTQKDGELLFSTEYGSDDGVGDGYNDTPKQLTSAFFDDL